MGNELIVYEFPGKGEIGRRWFGVSLDHAVDLGLETERGIRVLVYAKKEVGRFDARAKYGGGFAFWRSFVLSHITRVQAEIGGKYADLRQQHSRNDHDAQKARERVYHYRPSPPKKRKPGNRKRA